MVNAFISYSSKDEVTAQKLHSMLSMAGIQTFMAGISINPGKNWTDEIFEHLRKANWVFFLATKDSIKSSAVQQELGASIITKKILIPILIDITVEDLPVWIDRHQAIDIKNSPEVLNRTIEAISDEIKVDKFWAGVIVGALVILLLSVLKK